MDSDLRILTFDPQANKALVGISENLKALVLLLGSVTRRTPWVPGKPFLAVEVIDPLLPVRVSTPGFQGGSTSSLDTCAEAFPTRDPPEEGSEASQMGGDFEFL